MSARFNTNLEFGTPPISFAPIEYEQLYFNQYNETLRLYFNRVEGALKDGVTQEYAESAAWFMG
tara:strand:- start:249 stop:440 length:192 start_codon:yes stop_codon:yes gene_type:complete